MPGDPLALRVSEGIFAEPVGTFVRGCRGSSAVPAFTCNITYTAARLLSAGGAAGGRGRGGMHTICVSHCHTRSVGECAVLAEMAELVLLKIVVQGDKELREFRFDVLKVVGSRPETGGDFLENRQGEKPV